MARRIVLQINLQGGQTTAREVNNIRERFEALQEQMRALDGVSQQLGTNIDQTEQLLSGLGISADVASRAINGILLEQQGLREAGATINELGLSQDQADVLAGVLGNPEDIQQYIDLLNGLDTSLESISEVARLTGGSIADAEEFIEQLGLSAEDTARALRTVQAGQRVGADRDTQRQNLRNLGLNESQSEAILDRVERGVQRSDRGLSGLLTKVGLLSFGFNQALQAIRSFAAAGSQAYDALIGQNERLNQQILSVQSSLVANTDVFRGTVEIEDPTEAILALEEPIKTALRQIEVDSLELVGVTSSDLTQVFQILTQQTQALTNQSAELADPIEAASKLTIDFAATLGTLGVPLNQARQEIQSILTAQIDQNSVLAKSLGITNEQVRQYQQQGELVDFLRGRLEPFIAGNALAAQSVSGITSNLREVFEIVTRTAGEALYDDLVAQLQRLYDFVSQNQEAIASGVESAVAFLRDLLNTVTEGIEGIAQKLSPLANDIKDTLEVIAATGASELLEFVELLFDALNKTLEVLKPLLSLLSDILTVLNKTGLTQIIVEAAALITILGGIKIALAAIATTLTASVIPAAIATATAIAPLLPLLLAVGTAITVLNTFRLNKVNEAIDSYSASVKTAGDESIRYAQSLKELNNIEANGGTLTAEQVKQKENLIAISQSLIAQNKQQIEDLKNLETVNDSQANSVNNLIRQLEISNNTLGKQAGILDEVTGKVRVQSPALLELGTAYDQIQAKVEGNLEAIKRGTGNLLDVQKQAQSAIDLTQKQLEAGVITTEQAIANLQLIASNTKLTYEQQLAAQKAIFAALIKDVERVNQTIKQAENDRLIDLQKLLNSQLITEGEFNVKKAKLTTERIKQELEAEEDRLRQINRLDLSPEEKQEETRKAIAKTTELQLQLLQQEKAERDSIVSRVKEREDLITSSLRRETSEIVSGLKQQQDEYGEINRVIERRKTAQDVIIRNLETENRLINSISEVEAARRNLANVEGDVERSRITKILELRQKLNSGELKSARERREVVFELQRLNGFSSRTERDLQSDLKRLEEERFSRQIEAQKAEEERARTLLELELQRSEAAAKRAVIEAEIAENQAQQQTLAAQAAAEESLQSVFAAEGELNVAIASGNKENIANAQDRLRVATEESDRALQRVDLAAEAEELAGKQVEQAKEQVSVQEEIAENSRLTLNLQQKAANIQLEAEARARGQADELERGANAAVKLSTALNGIRNSEFGIRNGELITIEGRREGGAMKANTPYVVGEGAGGRFIPGISEIIVPNVDSFAIASREATEIFNQGEQNRIVNNSYTSTSVAQGNTELLNTAKALRKDIQDLQSSIANIKTTSVEGAQIINQFQDRNDKGLGMKFARDFLDELENSIYGS